MSRVTIESFVRSGDRFESAAEVDQYDGDCDHVPGAISLVIDGTEVLGVDLWDDVNWLWPFIVQALDDCRQTGSGNRGFPDQPISFRAEKVSAGGVFVSVTDGLSINRSAVAPAEELFVTAARAGLDFFSELWRLCPGTRFGESESEILAAWLA